MECLRSFNFSAQGSGFSTTAGANYLEWQDAFAKNTGFTFFTPLGNAMHFNPRGFKNIDLYGLKIGVYIQTSEVNPFNGVIQDYGITTNIVGQNPLLGGTFGSPQLSNYALTNNNMLIFSKQVNEYKFDTPIKSVSQIRLDDLRIQGFAPESLTEIVFSYFITIVGYYKFEGE
jgi:hypothetical protein